MCGLTGYIGSSSKGNHFLEQAIDSLAHRGPDGSSTFRGRGFAFGHNRLALIDATDGGIQPKIIDGHVLTFNGEIYNWKEIRRSLISVGINQKTNSDSETLLLSLVHFGLDRTLETIRGVFSFAYFNPELDSVILVRDQFGSRPLYLYENDESERVIYFASEIKAFLKLGLSIDNVALHEYLTFQNFIGRRTLFNEVRMLLPGTVTYIPRETLRMKTTEWFLPIFDRGEDDFELEILGEKFKEAVRRNMESDFPLGAYLSSGTDSNLVVSTAKLLGQSLPTFTIGFSDFGDTGGGDEIVSAKDSAGYQGLSNSTLLISPTNMEDSFDNLIWAIEEPRMGQSYPNFFAAKLASSQCKGVLTGTGGDELFGGYPWRYFKSEKGQLLPYVKSFDEYCGFWHRLLSPAELASIWGISEMNHLEFVKAQILAKIPDSDSGAESMALPEILRFEFSTFLPGLLCIEDKISMQFGIESRIPFLDQDLMHYAMQIPSKNLFRLSGNPNLFSTNVGKRPLRNLLKQLNPKVGELPKRGFSGPDLHWFNSKSNSWVKERIGNPNSSLWNYLPFEFFERRINGKISNNKDRLLIWSLLSLESSIRQFVDR